ncbi:hypothetical protein SAMN05421644_12815 [Allochromatium warmingii]|uniref:Uncharacterized protein n=1 Tax=Allochromatium warmingii TaxID=61595 RepID=A0A1H3GY32_ALLWA|nr:hypothetical protein [Allochromatium warmingii]SDY08192.1 hypothetical protein SAMN05421644_12815 [Allochromatium warmingii]
MNPTLQKLRQIAQNSTLSAEDMVTRKRELHASCAELAAPLVQAFRDVQGEFVRIAMLRRIWPDDYDQRDDHVAGLLLDWIGPESAPQGLKLAMPGGSLTFEVALKRDGSAVFTCVRDTLGQRPAMMDFANRDDWLEFFYKSIAELVEL